MKLPAPQRVYSLVHINRVFLLGGILVALAALVTWRWISGWGLITINARQVPLSKVIKTLEKQGGVKIRTNAPLDTLATLQVSRAPVIEALEMLADNIDGDVRVAYLAAPNKTKIAEILATFTANGESDAWAIFASGGGPGGGFMGMGGNAADPRRITWKVSDMPEKNLQAFFEQGAQKTGAIFGTPKDWNPPLKKFPGDGETAAVAAKAASQAKGKLEEVFLITVRPPRPEGERRTANDGQRGERWMGGGGRTVFSPRPSRERMNPDWAADRMEAQLAQLPAEERDAARKLFSEMRGLWAEARALPEEERRAKIEEFMNRQDVQDVIQTRMETRDARSTPEKREQRFRRYIDRKKQIKNRPSNS